MSEASYTHLDDFLSALRFEGIPIGPHELIRLQHVLRLAPTLDRDSFKDLLACTLIKQEKHRETFETLFNLWCQSAPEVTASSPHHPEIRITSQSPRNPILETAETKPVTQETSRNVFETILKHWKAWLLASVLVGTIALGYRLWPATPDRTPPTPPPPPTPTAASTPSPSELPSEPAAQFWTWVPEVDAPAPPLIDPVWFTLALALGTLLGGTWIAWRYKRRHTLPDLENPSDSGPMWLPLLPTQETTQTNPELLNRDDIRSAVWGVEQFVSEDETYRVDIDQTVDATANAGGLPTIRFEPAVYPREIWLWHDEMVQDPTIDRMLDELRHTLSQAGLPVRLGTFIDTPLRILWQDKQEFSPLTLEGHRQHALVVILTDGYGMQLATESALEQAALSNLLRAFRDWPRLTFVDVSDGKYGLAAQVSQHQLPCIDPQEIPAFLGAEPSLSTSRPYPNADLMGDLRAWAAATALASEPVTDSQAFELRQRLDLVLSTWDFRDLILASESWGERISWSPDKRTKLLNWLTYCSMQGQTLDDNSLLARALDYWIECYQHTTQTRQDRQNPLIPWIDTPAEQRLRMETAFLELWRAPAEAIPILYQLKDALGDEIRERLASMTDWDNRQADSRSIVWLPWSSRTLPIRLRWMLAKLGFEKIIPENVDNMRMPAALSLALGMCGGLAALALGTAIWDMMGTDLPVLRPTLPQAVQSVLIQELQRSGPNTYQLTIGTPKDLQVHTVSAKSDIDIKWNWIGDANQKKVGNSELWRAGTLPQASRGCASDWPRRSLVVIQADPEDKPAHQLAIQLLDQGSADAVLIGQDWADQINELVQVDATTDDQLLLILPPKAEGPVPPFQGRVGVVNSDDFHDLAQRLNHAAGTKPASEIWPGTNLDPNLKLRGGPALTKESKTDITFVEICGGTFTMGSSKSDDMAHKREHPSHQVTLSIFEMSQTEITNAQYRRFQKGHEGDDDLPAVNISWNEARAYCENYGYALPTEAEWEYAARGGSTARWSFGNDEALLDNYAWFDKNSGNRTHPVGTKLPNPLGLYDMHGNALEWVEDCIDGSEYESRANDPFLSNPLGKTNCQTRALRGGALFNVSRDLRSAVRGRVGPEYRLQDVGFRCVRRPRR